MRKYFLLFILSAGLLMGMSCNGQVYTANNQKHDTAYITTTRVLKNNHIPDSIFEMTGLRVLSITGMDCDYGDHINCWAITEIPARINRLQQLTRLTLNVNGISTIPVELASLKKLELLDLTDNPGLSHIEALTKITSLKSLYLYGCGLNKLPADIDALKNLKELGLVGNHLDKEEQKRIRKALPACNIHF